MEYRVLGRTGLRVSALGFGAWAIGGNSHGNSYGATDDATSVAAVQRAHALGCTFFDTADVYGYGHSEEVLGRALRESGGINDVVVATKVGGNFYGGQTKLDFSPDYIRYAAEQSLARLSRDHIDLYQLHNPPRQVLEDGRVFEVLDALKAEGKIRYIGCSIHTPAEGIAVLRTGKFDTLQVVYNILSLVQHDNPAENLFPAAREADVAIIAREPLANGFLTGKQALETSYEPGDIRASWPPSYRSARIRVADSLRFLQTPERTLTQAAIRFALDEPSIATVLVGVKSPTQAAENFAVGTQPPLSADEMSRINGVFFG